MSKVLLQKWIAPSSLLFNHLSRPSNICPFSHQIKTNEARRRRLVVFDEILSKCNVRRRGRSSPVDDDNEEEEEEKEEEDVFSYSNNEEISILETYSQSVKNEVLLVKAMVDDQQVEVLIFKGYSSCLNYSTCPDPSRSVIPATAVIKSIDRIRGPFDPSNINYIEKALTFHEFKARLNM